MTDYKEISLPQVAKRIAALRKIPGAAAKAKVNNLVVTGGEPLLQQKLIAQLLVRPELKGMEVEFETNGSQILSSELAALKPSFNISPKLADSGNKPYKVNFYPNSVLKFVYVSKKSEALIDGFLKDVASA